MEQRQNTVSRDDEAMVAVAHELKTPLTTIRSVTEILQDNPDLTDEERDRFLVMLAEETDRLNGTIDRMLRSSTASWDRWCVGMTDIVRQLRAA